MQTDIVKECCPFFRSTSPIRTIATACPTRICSVDAPSRSTSTWRNHGACTEQIRMGHRKETTPAHNHSSLNASKKNCYKPFANSLRIANFARKFNY